MGKSMSRCLKNERISQEFCQIKITEKTMEKD
jgi:hypothetical protein